MDEGTFEKIFSATITKYERILSTHNIFNNIQKINLQTLIREFESLSMKKEIEINL